MERKHMQNLRLVDGNGMSSANEELGSGVRDWQNDEGESQHPYQYELDNFRLSEAHISIPEKIQSTLPLEQTKLFTVQSVEELEKLVQTLNSVKEFAFDVEHHDLRSFLGLTCLLQISTREADYIVDPFPVWKSMYLLNEPFTNPKILKVAHSADNDLLWLQRDFGIFALNLFDTKCAMELLKFSKYNLKYLVQTVCGVDLDKTFQRADWRVRPLPDSLLNYARQDTHYLLNCYDHLKTKLAAMDPFDVNYSALELAFMRSMQICHLLYEQPRFNPKSYSSKLLCAKRRFNNRQLYALEQMWRWRDQVAREQDESLHYILPDYMMLQIAEVLPKESQGIIACCSPIPPLVRHEILTLHKIITVARDLPLEQIAKNNAFEALMKGNTDEVFSDPTLEANRITKHKAKLDYRFDCTSHKADEIIPQFFPANFLEIAKGAIVEKPSDRSHFVLRSNKKPAKGENVISVVEIEEKSKEEKEEVFKKINVIADTVNKWATPYDCYLVALKRAEEREKERMEQKPDISIIVGEKKKRYSHLDEYEHRVVKSTTITTAPTITGESFTQTLRQISAREKTADDDNVDEDELIGDNLTVVTEPQDAPSVLGLDRSILTKKARKRLRKSMRKEADISLN